MITKVPIFDSKNVEPTMRRVHRKLLISFLAVFLICLIVSTSTTTVTAEEEWGTLKAGDVMEWQSTHYDSPYVIKILNVEGELITIEWQRGASIFVSLYI